MGRSHVCNCRCGGGGDGPPDPPPDGGCCVPSSATKMLKVVPASEASRGSVDYSVKFYDEPYQFGDGSIRTHYSFAGYWGGADLFFKDLASTSRYPTCNSFTEAPFINYYLNDESIGDFLDFNQDNPTVNQTLYFNECWRNQWDSGVVELSYPAYYYYHRGEYYSVDPVLRVQQSGNNSEIIVRTTSGAVPEYKALSPWAKSFDIWSSNYITCNSVAPSNSIPIGAWGLGPGITWKRWSNPYEHNIYYVVSGICNTHRKGAFTLQAEIQAIDDLEYSWQAVYHTDRDRFTLFENDGFGCCCDNYVLQFSSGVIIVPADNTSADCSGCLEMKTYTGSSDPVAWYFGGHLKASPHAPAPEFGVKFFENKQDYEDHLNALDLISIYDAVYPVGESGIGQLENSILRSDLRNLSGIPELTCLDGTTVVYDNDFTYLSVDTPVSGFSWEGYEYSIEPSGGKACMQQLFSLGLASKDPANPYYPDSTGILEGTTFIQDQPSQAVKFTLPWLHGGFNTYDGDYWVSGSYGWDNNFNLTHLDIFENTSGVTNKALIYIFYYGSYSWDWGRQDDCSRLGTGNEWSFQFEGGYARVPNVYVQYHQDGDLPPLVSDWRRVPNLTDEPSGFKNLTDLNSITLKNTANNNCIAASGSERFFSTISSYDSIGLYSSGTQRFYPYYMYNILDSYWYCDSLVENWARIPEDPNNPTREDHCSYCDWIEENSNRSYDLYSMAYEFDLTPKNMLLLQEFNNTRFNSYWWSSNDNDQFNERFKYKPHVYNIALLTKLLLRLDATPHQMSTDTAPNQQSFPNLDPWFGTAHLLDAGSDIEEYTHMYYSDPCLSPRATRPIVENFTGELVDIDEQLGVGLFIPNSMTARDPIDGQLKQVGNPCNPCWYCGTDSSCSTGERDSTYVVIKGNFSWDDIGEEFYINKPEIDCTSYIFFNGWAVPGISLVNWNVDGNSLDC